MIRQIWNWGQVWLIFLGIDMWIGFVSVEFKKKMVIDCGRKSVLNDFQFNVYK